MESKKSKLKRITVGTVSIDDEAKKRVMKALDSGWISSGRMVSEFERRFAGYHRAKNCVAVSSGTDANTIALATLHEFGKGRRNEVLLPALTFIATANSVIHARFKPIFVDVNLDNYNISADGIKKAITERTRAIMPVHLFGRPCDMDPILEIAAKHDLGVVEDCAEAHGAEYRGKKVGTFGDMGAFSFYVAHIITTGEGGAVITNNDEYSEVLLSLRAHGRACVCKKCVLNISAKACPIRFTEEGHIDKRFLFTRVGYSCKMNELEASLGISQIERLDEIIDKRRKNLEYLNKHLSEFEDYLQLPNEGRHGKISPLAYNVLIRKNSPFERSELVDFLEKNGIETRPMFGSIPTQQPGYSFLKQGNFKNASFVGSHGFYIGCHQDLTREDLDRIIDVVSSFIWKS